MFVLFLWNKFSVNDIIHSEKLNKMYQDNSEIEICSANAVITPKSFQFPMGSKLPNLLYMLHQQIVALCTSSKYFIYPRKDSGP